MARQLWLLRHGEAEPHGVRPDADRALTSRGRDQALAAGVALSRLDVGLAVAFTSPKLRARQTAELAVEPLRIDLVEHGPIGGGFDRDEALALLGAGSDDGRVLVVGHEPDLSQVVRDLTGARVDFKKGGIAVVRVDGSTGGSLLALLRPRELAALAG